MKVGRVAWHFKVCECVFITTSWRDCIKAWLEMREFCGNRFFSLWICVNLKRIKDDNGVGQLKAL